MDLQFQKESTDLEKSMEDMNQTQHFITQSIDRLEAQMSQLVNTCRNKKTLLYHYLINPDISNSVDLAQESCCFENQDSILLYYLELDQYRAFDKLASFISMKLNLNMNVTPTHNFVIQFQFLNIC